MYAAYLQWRNLKLYQKNIIKELPGGSAGYSVVTAVAQVAAVVWVWSLVLELPHATGVAKKKKKIIFKTFQSSHHGSVVNEPD